MKLKFVIFSIAFDKVSDFWQDIFDLYKSKLEKRIPIISIKKVFVDLEAKTRVIESANFNIWDHRRIIALLQEFVLKSAWIQKIHRNQLKSWSSFQKDENGGGPSSIHAKAWRW